MKFKKGDKVRIITTKTHVPQYRGDENLIFPREHSYADELKNKALTINEYIESFGDIESYSVAELGFLVFSDMIEKCKTINIKVVGDDYET